MTSDRLRSIVSMFGGVTTYAETVDAMLEIDQEYRFG